VVGELDLVLCSKGWQEPPARARASLFWFGRTEAPGLHQHAQEVGRGCLIYGHNRPGLDEGDEPVFVVQHVSDGFDFDRAHHSRGGIHDQQDVHGLDLGDASEHAEARGFSVEADLVTPEGASASTIRVDEEAFRRVVRNLLDNAVKYSPVCRTVWVDGTICDRRVLISVRDQGMGINAEEKQAIFQKFVRGQAAKRAGIKGTGIGLAMVRQISEAMGGEIRVQSEVGVGSTFTLVLPLAED